MNTALTIRTICSAAILGTCTFTAFAGEDAATPPETGDVESSPATAPEETPAENAPPAATSATGGGAATPLEIPAATTNLQPMRAPAGYLVPAEAVREIGTEVEDLLTSTRDMVQTIRARGQGLELSDWQNWSQSFETAGDWLSRRGKLSVTDGFTPAQWNGEVVEKLGSISGSLASMGQFIDSNRTRLGTLGNVIVDDVDDVRNDVSELVRSITENAPNAGFPDWAARDEMYGPATSRLSELQKRLMEPMDAFDEAAAGDVATTLRELAGITSNVRQTLTFAE